MVGLFKVSDSQGPEISFIVSSQLQHTDSYFCASSDDTFPSSSTPEVQYLRWHTVDVPGPLHRMLCQESIDLLQVFSAENYLTTDHILERTFRLPRFIEMERCQCQKSIGGVKRAKGVRHCLEIEIAKMCERRTKSPGWE